MTDNHIAPFEYYGEPVIVFVGRRPSRHHIYGNILHHISDIVNQRNYYQYGQSEQSEQSEQLEKLKETKTYKYKFLSSNPIINSTCIICFENFKKNDIMCINSCYHYWCQTCENQFKKNMCPVCKIDFESNVFLDSKGSFGKFPNSSYSNEVIEIIKKDLESESLTGPDLTEKDLIEDINNLQIDEFELDYIESKALLESID